MFSDQTVIDYMNLSLTIDVALTVGFVALVVGITIYDNLKSWLHRKESD